jgi:hypothetical protein
LSSFILLFFFTPVKRNYVCICAIQDKSRRA